MPSTHETNIFVSSVYQELVAYRRAALDAVWRCDYYPTGMEREDYAMPHSTSESSRRMVDRADVYVGIFSHRYGVVTVEELRRAQERGIPILLFMATAPLNDEDVETDPDRTRLLDELKRELLHGHKYVVAMFGTAEELGAKVYRSLVAMRDAGQLPTTERTVAAIPVPPASYYAHPYFLGGAGFVGRRPELAQLDAWAAAAGEPLLLVEAIGGAGKSALAWEWIRHLDAVLPRRAGLIWWSFYESDGTMGNFLARSLAYLGERKVEDCARLPRFEQEAQLLAALAARPVVVVLDGLERLLTAYHRLDASQLADDAVESKRACVDPRDGALLRALTRCAPSKVLITTRLVPADLQDRAGQLVQGVRPFPLSGLGADDAIALMARAGVRGDHALMRMFLGQFGDHALLVQVLAGRIAAYRPAPGDFDAWYQAVGRHLRLDATDLKARQASVLDAALADLDPAVFRFLCQLAAFRYPVDYAALVALNPFTEPLRGEAAAPSRPAVGAEAQRRYDAEAALARLHRALGELEERGLVQWDRQNNRYDLHPVVRAYAYARLEDKPATFARLRGYFEALPPEDTRQAQDVADLRRTLEIYHALVESGLFDEAWRLYRDRLRVALREYLGAYATIVELVTPLFPDGLAAPPALADPRDQSLLVTELALPLDNLGDFARARALHGVAVRLDLQAQNAAYLAADLLNLGESFRDEGRHPAAAERALLLGRDLAAADADQRTLAQSQTDLLSLYSLTGAWEAGERAYAAVLASPDDDIKRQAIPPIRVARLRFGQGQDPMPLLAEGLDRARRNRFPRAEREALRLQGEVALARGDLPLAEESWQAAYAISQRTNQPLGPYLADLARLRARQGNTMLARDLIAEALAAGGPGVALAAAEVALARGDTAEAAGHALQAYREAWADGPPYALAFELDRARAVYRALGQPEPALPPFDPAQVPPVPEEAAVRAFIDDLEQKRGARDSAAVDGSQPRPSSAPPASERAGGDEPEPGAFDESRLGVSIAPRDARRDEPGSGGFDESRLAPSITGPEPMRDPPATAGEREEDPAEAHGQGAPGAPAAPAGRRRRVWPWTWGRK